MVGDWLVTGELRQRFESGEIKPGSDDYNKVLNTTRLTAGAIALLYDFDVDTAANEALVAVQNNALVKSDDIKNFYLHYNTYNTFLLLWIFSSLRCNHTSMEICQL